MQADSQLKCGLLGVRVAESTFIIMHRMNSRNGYGSCDSTINIYIGIIIIIIIIIIIPVSCGGWVTQTAWLSPG